MKKALQIFLFTTVYYTTSFGQTFTLYGDRAYGTNKAEKIPVAFDAGNGNIIIAGSSTGNVNSDKTEPLCDSMLTGDDIWMLKIDTAFNIIWNKSYGGREVENTAHLLKKNESQFLLTCTSMSDSNCERSSHNRSIVTPFHEDYWICTIDSSGNKINDYAWGANGVDRYPQTIVLPSGNIIHCGVSVSQIDADKTVPNYDTTSNTSDYWVVKTDSTGNKLWDKVYGGAGEEISGGGFYNYLFNMIPEENDDFILAGSTLSPSGDDITDTSRGNFDIWIIKIDQNGNKVWDKRYGGSDNDYCNHIISTDDKGYLLCGTTYSPQGFDVTDTSKGGITDCWVIKLDSLGNKQWDKRYGGNQSDNGVWVEKAPDGGYLISGGTASDIGGDVTESKYGSSFDYWIFKIDDAGNKIWDKRFGGPGLNTGSTFIIMPDSSIFLFGESGPGTNAVKTDPGKGQVDYWVVHFKYTCAITAATINPVACNSYTSPSENYNWTSSGIYNDTIQNAAGCDSVITINLTINTVDTSVTANAPYLSSNATGAAYQWMYCDSSLIAGATNQSYNATANGSYAVIVTENGCTDTSSCYLILNVGIEEKTNESVLNVYPNPVRDVLIISLNKPLHTNDVITISDMQGRVIKEESISENNNKDISIDVSTLSQGVYLLKVNENIHRFVKM